MIASAAEVRYIKAFLQYLHDHFSRAINPNDKYLILAIDAWFHQESGGLNNVIGNNPFNIRTSPLQSGTRLSKNGNGHFAVFKSMEDGFRAAAYLLMVGGHGAGSRDRDSYGYRLAIRALKLGGNTGAVNFLVAMAMSSWDAGKYGTKGHNPADPKYNHLLRVYSAFTGLTLPSSRPSQPKHHTRTVKYPRVLQPPPVPQQYLTGWEPKAFYNARHHGSSAVD